MVKSRSRPALLECLEFPLQTDEQHSSGCGGFPIGEDNPCDLLWDVVHGDSRWTVKRAQQCVLLGSGSYSSLLAGPITRSSGDLGQSYCAVVVSLIALMPLFTSLAFFELGN